MQVPAQQERQADRERQRHRRRQDLRCADERDSAGVQAPACTGQKHPPRTSQQCLRLPEARPRPGRSAATAGAQSPPAARQPAARTRAARQPRDGGRSAPRGAPAGPPTAARRRPPRRPRPARRRRPAPRSVCRMFAADSRAACTACATSRPSAWPIARFTSARARPHGWHRPPALRSARRRGARSLAGPLCVCSDWGVGAGRCWHGGRAGALSVASANSLTLDHPDMHEERLAVRSRIAWQSTRPGKVQGARGAQMRNCRNAR